MNKIDMFFEMMAGMYGKSAFNAAYPDDKYLQLAKAQWSGEINKYSEEELSKAFENTRKSMVAGNNEAQWVNVALILQNAPRRAHKSHEIFLPPPEETEEQKAARREKAKAGIDGLKNLFN